MKKDEGLREYPEEGTPDTASASNNTLVSGIADGGRLDEVVERNPATEPMARSQPSNQGPSEHNGGVYSNPDATLTCLLPSPSLPDHPWQTWCPPAQTSQYDPQLPWWVLVASPSEIAGETYCSVNGK